MEPNDKLELALELPADERVILALQMADPASQAAIAALGDQGWAEAWAAEVERRWVELSPRDDLGADDSLLGLLFDADAL